jgi:G:T-mismatch repair DNA endonuclease (very short patch repair protein)
MREISIKVNMNMCPSRHSKPELEIKKFILGNGIECRTDRKILKGKEIDIYIPDKNIGIEYNGNLYHTEWFGGKSRQYHLNKTKLCKQKGRKLIHIFEDEFYNTKEIALNKIAHILGIQQSLPRIYGRKCTIRQIDKNEAEIFLTKYHIQGFDPSTVHYGAFYKDELIAVMSFLKSKKEVTEWELTRFASNYNYICCGVGGKLFKHFIKEYNPNSVKSFADRRWTVDEENNVYIKLGFEFDGYTKPDYKYYNSTIDKYKRFHKFGFRKQVLLKKYPDILNENMTETEMVKKLGYDRIWDCGLIRYIWKNETIN